MTREEAIKTLKLAEGYDKAAVKDSFASLSAEVAQKYTTAASPALRSVYEQQSARLRAARDLLLEKAGTLPAGSPLSATKQRDLPSLAPIEAASSHPGGRNSTASPEDWPKSLPGSPLSRTELLDIPRPDRSFTSDAFGSNPLQIAASLGIHPGQRLQDRYEVIAPLGAGGMGAVFSAKDLLRDEEIAIKVLLPHLIADPKARERFLNEAKIAGSLAHANIVRVYDVHETDGLTFLTMELLKGRSLRDEIVHRAQASQRFSVPEVLAITDQLCSALQTAHKTTVHRDVKPENVWLCEDGTVKLMDFGIARLLRPSQFTSTGMALGTAYYMAPEQLRGLDVDHKADQYAMGVMLYELLTGAVPQGAIRAPRQIRRSVPSAMSAAVMKALDGDPQRRYADIAAFRRALTSRSAARVSTRMSLIGGGVLAIGAAFTFPTWWPLLVANAESEHNVVASSPQAKADKEAEPAFLARRGAVEAIKKTAETIDGEIESVARETKTEINERLAAIWRRHMGRQQWIQRGDEKLKSALSNAERGSFKQALADLEAAEAEYLKPGNWRSQALKALESIEATRVTLEQKLEAIPRESTRGLLGWPEALVNSVVDELAKGDGSAGVAEALRISEWLPQGDELLGLRQRAVATAKDAKDGQNVDALRDRLTAANERLRDGDLALKGDRSSDARRLYTTAQSELALVRDELNDYVDTLMRDGRKALKEGSYKTALDRFGLVLKAQPGDVTAGQLRYRAGISEKIAEIHKRENAGQPDEALKLLADLRRNDPDDADVRQLVEDLVAKTVLAGTTALQNEQFDDATIIFQRLRNFRPDVEVSQHLSRVRTSQKTAEARDRRIAEQNRLAEIARQEEADRRARVEAEQVAEEARQARAAIAAREQEDADRQERYRQAQRDAEARRRGFGNPNSHTFGGLGVPNPGGGIYLTGSVPGTPAASLGLENGDVIMSINGVSISTQAEYVQAVHNSPDVMQFVLRNYRTGQLQNMTARLSRPN